MLTDQPTKILLQTETQEIKLGETSWDHAKQFQQELAVKLPNNSCMNVVTTQLRHGVCTESTSTRLASRGVFDTGATTPELTISLLWADECKCSTRKCLGNIRNGKCTDPYIIEHIGKKFFADKYAQKTK